MTEGRALLLAAGLHLLLLLGLSLGLASHLSMVAEPDVTPVEFVNITDVAQVTEPPKRSAGIKVADAAELVAKLKDAGAL